ncbi:5-hydroxytryptamine receptor 3A-like [Dendrobates tinctorius]|uniref:5-hydroxytryptamine receptor 3A-like n=1 Tax=Dendrobates tinctorius TaxID=92724 RepID=UPI003CC9A821
MPATGRPSQEDCNGRHGGLSSCQDCSYKSVTNITFPSSAFRPVKMWTDATSVWVDISLYDIINVFWQNEFISWDPNLFCGIWYLYLRKEKFWRPDIYIYEMTDTEDKSQPPIYTELYWYGGMVDFKMQRVVTSCDLNIYKFPFDKQTCNISLGSYVYPASEIRFISDSEAPYNRTKESYREKGAWKLVNTTVLEDNYIAGGEIYSRIILMIIIQRIPQDYIVSFILPICFMVLLDIASMFIEMPKNDRLGFKISNVLGFSMLLLILNDIMPLSHTPPLLGIFCSLMMAAMVISIIESVFTAYILMLTDTQTNVPHWIEIVFVKYLSRILCFNRVKVSDTNQPPDPEPTGKSSWEAESVPMQVDALQRRESNECREHRFQQSLCFYCSQSDHFLINCPKRPHKVLATVGEFESHDAEFVTSESSFSVNAIFHSLSVTASPKTQRNKETY